MKILNKSQCEKFVKLARSRLSQYLKDNRLSGMVMGISGGIDSAVTAAITQTVSSDNQYYFLDCESEQDDYKRASVLANKLKINLKRIDLTDWYRQSPLLSNTSQNHIRRNISLGNIKARLRMISLYHIASLNNLICLDTDDLSEGWMGFWTRHGDEGDVKIIQQVMKSELYDLGEYLGLPEVILRSEPGDGLGVTDNHKAEDQLGLNYPHIDYILNRFIGKGFDVNGDFEQIRSPKITQFIKKVSLEIKKPEENVKKILTQVLKTGYKRKYGYYCADLMADRHEFDFLKIGSTELMQKLRSI